MKIGIITSPFGVLPPKGIGAVEKLWYYMAKYFSKKGHDVSFYAKASNSYNEEKEINIYQISGYLRTNSIIKDIVKDLFYSLKALIRLKPCDILILNTFWTPLLCVFFRWKYKKCIYNVARFPKGQFKLYRFVDQLSCVSMAVSKALEKEIGKDKRIVTVNNPVNLEDFKYVPEKEGDDFVIMYHGRVHPEKGLHILVAAANYLCEKFPQLKVKILGATQIELGGGGDEYVEQLRQIASKVPIVWLDATGNPKVIANEIASSNLYCYPSVAAKGETFGVAPLEAMAVGRCVIVSDLDCFKDFIEDGTTGFIFDHNSENAVMQLSHIMENLIVHPELRQKVGFKAFQRAQEFSIENISEQYIRNFELLIQGNI